MRRRSKKTHAASVLIRALLDEGLNTTEIAERLGRPVEDGGMGYETTGTRVRQICRAYGLQPGQSGRRRFGLWLSRRRSKLLVQAAEAEGVSPAVMLERCVAVIVDDGYEKAVEVTRGHAKFVRSLGRRL